jgi:hypothetical protein
MKEYQTPQEYFNEDDMTSRLTEMVEESLNEADMLCEMAEIGRVDDFIVYVWTRDGGEIPHFHVGDAGTFSALQKILNSSKN